jgi:hypothetical protein
MNMRWYVAIFDDAGDELHERVGLTPEFHRAHQTGTVDLEHHTHFKQRLGDHDFNKEFLALDNFEHRQGRAAVSRRGVTQSIRLRRRLPLAV